MGQRYAVATFETGESLRQGCRGTKPLRRWLNVPGDASRRLGLAIRIRRLRPIYGRDMEGVENMIVTCI